MVQSEKDCHEHRGDSSKAQRVRHGTISLHGFGFFFGRNREDSVGSKLGGMWTWWSNRHLVSQLPIFSTGEPAELAPLDNLVCERLV